VRHLDLFSGIGGFALAASWCWGDEYVNVGHSEIEKFCCQVYHRHFPESECLGDITKIEWQKGQAELITAGFPCQPHSLSGKRQASNDDRDLWPECFRALREIRPSYALFENVPGLLTSDNGRFFNRVLADMASVGYDAEWETISAEDVGAPMERKRIWIVAYPFKKRRKGILQIDARGGSKADWQTVTLDLQGDCFLRFESWSGEPAVFGMADGLPKRLDVVPRLEALGNSIVPQVAYETMKAIRMSNEFDNSKWWGMEWD